MALKIVGSGSTKAAKKQKGGITFIEHVIKGETYLVMAQSSVQLEDEFANLYYSQASPQNLFLQPPFDPNVLLNLVQTNNILNQCIEAMEVNIDGTGYELVPVEEGKDIDPKEEKAAKAFFDEPYPNTSFVSIRRKARRQLESIGYSFLEVLRSVGGEVVGLRNLETPQVRMVKLDLPVRVKKTIARDGKDVQMELWMRERRFAQMMGLKERTYYREWDTSRQLNRLTGQWADADTTVPPEVTATELLVQGINPDIQTPYYLPRWINNLPSVIGSRNAEEQNLQFLDAGGLPPAIVFIQGGTIIKDTADQLRMYLSGMNKNKNRAVVVEVQSSSGSLDAAGKVDVKVERFGSAASNDAMFKEYDAATEEHVRTAFRLPPLFLGKAADYNFACYDSETETLTDQGWKRVEQITPEMQVGVIDPATRHLRFEAPLALSCYDVQDVPMYQFRSKGIVDLCVTPNHRMWYRPADGSLRVEPVEHLVSHGRVRVPVTAEWQEGTALTEFAPPHVVVRDGPHAYLRAPWPMPAEVFLTFMGWYASEGHTLNTTYAVLTQHPDRGLPQIRQLTARLEALNYTVREQTLPNGCVQVQIGDYSLVAWLKKEVRSAECKRLPQWMLHLPQAQLRVLFDALMAGDGTRDGRPSRRSLSYSSVSRQLADQVQELAFKLGYCAAVRTDRPGTLGTLPVHRVLMSERTEAELWASRNYERVQYSGQVHCLTVSTGVYVTRRHGKIALQGNTAQTAYMVAEAQVFGPERVEFDEMINKTIVKAMGWKTLKLRSKPITLKDVATQLKGMELSKDVATRESFIKEMNTIAGMSLEMSDVPATMAPGEMHEPLKNTPTADEMDSGKLPASMSSIMPTPKPEPKEPAPPEKEPTENEQEMESLKIREQREKVRLLRGKKTATEIITLAHDYAALKGLVQKGDPLTVEASLQVAEAVAALTGDDLDAFNRLWATYAFGDDSDDLAAVAMFNRG